MDKYLLLPHFFVLSDIVNRSACLVVLTFIIMRKTQDYHNTNELGVPQNRVPRPYYSKGVVIGAPALHRGKDSGVINHNAPQVLCPEWDTTKLGWYHGPSY